MDKLQKAWAIFQTVAPWLVVSLIPSLITGFSKYPKVVTWLHRVLWALSILTHVDSPGTLKAPFMPAKAPDVSVLS